jgi:ring-1,2-phenylacetyl-CoA epoxidase subunit PaaC
MQAELRDALALKLLAMADDELILGHRNSEWTGHGPILEEDIAFTNIALDELGHATLWYGLHAELIGEVKDTYPDHLAYFRPAANFRCAPMMELPKGDWAFSMLRQYLFDAAEAITLRRLVKSGYQPLADAAAKIQREELYHLRHTSAWVKRLGLGTEESHRRLQAALDALWPYAVGVFDPLPDESRLAGAGFVTDPNTLRDEWNAKVRAHLGDSGLNIPAAPAGLTFSRFKHTAGLAALLDELQEVARAHPDARW